MNRIFKFSYILIALFFFIFSCNKNNDYTTLIPSDAEFVALINPKAIADKGNFSKLEQYKIIQLADSLIKSQDPSVKELFDDIRENPISAGIDIISPIYIFGQKVEGKNMVALTTNMRDKNKFENHLKKIFKGLYGKDITLKQKNGFTYIENHPKPFITWNKTQFLIVVSEFGTTEESINNYFTKLINDKKSLIKENTSFADFVQNSQDINFWYTENFLKEFRKSDDSSLESSDLSKNSWANIISFTSDGINFTQKFHPNASTKTALKEKPIWKSRINTDFFKYFPDQSYANIGLGIYPANDRSIFKKQNFLTNFFAEYHIDLSKLENSFEGDALFSIYDFEFEKSFNSNDFLGGKDNFIKHAIYPQFILAGRMKDRTFFDNFIQSHSENIKNEGIYYTLPISMNINIHLAYRNQLMYITNNQVAMTNFLIDHVRDENFVTSPYAKNASNGMFGYLNLNLEQYPLQIQQYLYEQIPFGNTTEIKDILSKFEYLDYRVSDEYTKTGKIHMKKSNQNSLEILLLLIDKAYSLFFTQPQE